jgi:hypothetical protein
VEYYGETVARDSIQSRQSENRSFVGAAVCFRFLVLLFLSFPVATAQSDGGAKDSGSTQASAGYVGNQACAGCHASIYASYKNTAMAHASGPATENLEPADFVHLKSGVHYRIYAEGEKAWLSFQRPGDALVNGQRQLLYFIGSGHRGRSYLFAVDDFFFESPVNWYAGRKVWDMAPAYENAREIPLTLPAYSSCLECHTTGMHVPLAGTENEYSAPLFTQNGVGCERCHGPGAAHLKGAPIVNPAKLSPERRDSVCMQCHLEGNVAIERRGRHVYDFRPGDLLDDFVRHYVLAGSGSSGLGANSQFEALAQSTCKKRSGDAMSCTSCHNPHFSPSSTEERAAYFRGKCLACHGNAFAAKHHPENLDCTACHMPSSLSADISHTEVTDHRIQRRPELSPNLLRDATVPTASVNLIPFPDSKEAEEDVRDIALAWFSVAENGDTRAAQQVDRLLPLAAKESPDDRAVLSALAFTELNRGNVEQARALYQKALALDPDLIDAVTNMGVIEAKDGNLKQAVLLWQKAFEHAPGKSSIGMNLARAFCSSGQIKEARSYVERVLRFNPDLTEAKKLKQSLEFDPPKCGP